jgi:hypothetical protein
LVIDNDPGNAFSFQLSVDRGFDVSTVGGFGWRSFIPISGSQWSFRISGHYRQHKVFNLLKKVTGEHPEYKCDRLSLTRLVKPYMAMSLDEPSPNAVEEELEEDPEEDPLAEADVPLPEST